MRPAECLCKIDKLGRMVLPKIIREKYELNEGDSLEIFTENDKIIMKKYQPSCIFCGEADDLFTYKNKIVCKNCIKDMQK